MDIAEFWQIIDAADTPGALQARLASLPDDGMIAFERHHDALMDRAYEWALWGAAYVINGGCGDDSFEYFRAYLVSRGRDVWEAALADPDSLAAVEIGDDEDWEDWMSPTMSVVHARTGEYAFAGPPDPDRRSPDAPSGEEWEEDDLPGRFPLLTAKYG